MRIGIDISQIVYEGTGVSTYVRNIIVALLSHDTQNTYILFGSSLRKRSVLIEFIRSLKHSGLRFRHVILPFPPSVLDILWNRLHVVPIEWFIGNVDVYWSSDWTQPPTANAKTITTIHDVSFLRFPDSFSRKIIRVHKKRLFHVIAECSAILCDSEATKKDIMKFYNVNPKLLHIVYPGFTA